MPVVADGAGGGGRETLIILTAPTSINLGTAPVGGTLTGTFNMRAYGGIVAYGSITTNDVDFIVDPPLIGSIPNGGNVNHTIHVSKGVAGVYTSIVTIPNTSDSGVRHITVTATFVAAGSTLVATPGSVDFPVGVLDAAPNDQIVAISNNTGGLVAVTSVDIVGLPFSYVGPATPFNIADGASVNITLRASYSVVGVFKGSAVINSALGPLTIPLTITVFFLISVDILQNTSRAVLLNSTNNSKKFDGTSFDPAFDCVLIFNDTFWDNPGNEKVLRRVEVLYENVGVCSGLKLDIATWRQTLTPPAFDTDTDTITIGDVSADLSERSAFFDVELAGELIVAQLTRLLSTGPVSILALIPHFEDKGEKVENV